MAHAARKQPPTSAPLPFLSPLHVLASWRRMCAVGTVLVAALVLVSWLFAASAPEPARRPAQSSLGVRRAPLPRLGALDPAKAAAIAAAVVQDDDDAVEVDPDTDGAVGTPGTALEDDDDDDDPSPSSAAAGTGTGTTRASTPLSPSTPTSSSPSSSITPPKRKKKYARKRRIWPEIAHFDNATVGTRTVPSPFSDFPAENELWALLLKQRCALDWSKVVALQLRNWADTGITRAQVDQFCVRKAFRISMVAGVLRMGHYSFATSNLHRVRCALWLIKMVALRATALGRTVPDFEINLQPSDGSFSTSPPHRQWPNAGPLLGNVKCQEDVSVSFPMTIHDQFGDGDGRMSLHIYETRYRESLEFGRAGGPWKDKINQMFFSAGAGATDRGNRSRLFEMQSPLVLADPRGHEMKEYGEYKFLVYAYGHCGWSRRLHELAFMNSVILMEASSCREFVHYIFDSEREYIGVAEDFADLLGKLEAAAANPAVSEAMAGRWVAKGTQAFSLVCMLDYVEALLHAYAKLQRFVPPPRPTWPEYKLDSGRDYFDDPGADITDECVPPPAGPRKERGHIRSHEC